MGRKQEMEILKNNLSCMPCPFGVNMYDRNAMYCNDKLGDCVSRKQALDCVDKRIDELKADKRFNIEKEICISGVKKHIISLPSVNVLDQVFDKISAEIMQLDYDIESIDYDYNDMTHTEEVHTICREEVLRIIDKYKSE